MELSGGLPPYKSERDLTPARRPSIDSNSSYTSNEMVMVLQNQKNLGGKKGSKKSKMVIKKNMLKAGMMGTQGTTRVFTQTANNIGSVVVQHSKPSDSLERTYSNPNPAIFGQTLQGQILGTQQYISHTDHSDSEISMFET